MSNAASNPVDPLVGAPLLRWHPKLYVAEFVGTALLVFGGLSIVIALNGASMPLSSAIPSDGFRRAVTGFLFGSIGASIAFSPIGKISGAHINPAMTIAFLMERKIVWRDALGYVVAQLLGAVAGAALLAVWGASARGMHYAATIPDPAYSPWLAVLGEAICTYALVTLIFLVASKSAIQRFTPLVNPPLFAILVWLEAPLSGTSANPARSFGPAVVAHVGTGFWVYVVGPLLGSLLAVAIFRLEPMRAHRPREARTAHFRFPHPRFHWPAVAPAFAVDAASSGSE